MKDYKYMLVGVEEQVATVTINRPEVLNTLSCEVLGELKSVMLELEADAAVKVIVLTGSGEKAFVAGADISQMAKMDAQQGRIFAQAGHDTFNTIENLAKPVIAAINGFAIGGGCELSMACDIRIASEKANFSNPEVNLGIIPGFGGTQRLLRLVGKGMAKLLIMSARMVTAQEALRIGLADMVVAPEALLPEAKKLALEIAGKSPNAIRIAKETINAGSELGLTAGNVLEAAKFGECFACQEQKEGMAAFLEKRPAKF